MSNVSTVSGTGAQYETRPRSRTSSRESGVPATRDGFSRQERTTDPTAAFKKAAALQKTAQAEPEEAQELKVKRKFYRVEPGTVVDLAKIDPTATPGVPKDDAEVERQLHHVLKKIDKLQEKLYGEHKHKVLIVLQGMDTSGKDGTIRSVFRGVNPQGVKVTSFKAPTAEQLDHDYLWRVHQAVPGKGEIGIFNRSHYEDVLVTRVHDMIDDSEAERRFDQINSFEKLLTDEGTTIVKFFLHIDKDEQKKRLQERLDDPDKRWKFSTADLAERKYWKDYQEVYADAIGHTSTEKSPWYVVPANDKLRRNLVVATVLLKTLEDLDIQTPEPQVKDFAHIKIK